MAAKDSGIDIAVMVDEVPSDYPSVMVQLWKLSRMVNPHVEPVLLSN